MANVLKQYCDGFLYGGIACEREIESDDMERCIAFPTESGLNFLVWDESLARASNVLHFHNPNCAKSYLEHWLQQKQNPGEEPKQGIILDTQ